MYYFYVSELQGISYVT